MPSREIYMTIDRFGRGVVPHTDRERLKITPGTPVTIRITEVNGKEV